MRLSSIIDTTQAKKDKNGIWVMKIHAEKELSISKKAWENIYNLNLQEIKREQKIFRRDKLKDHIEYITKNTTFNNKTVYLEIGCGPAYIANYLMKKYGCQFIGVDFNYKVLLSLKKHLEEQKLHSFELIHADISQLPLKSSSVDYIYGGGVIEHTPHTLSQVKELKRVLKKGGISFNTVPAFNLFWLTRFWMSIPAQPPFIKKLLSVLHVNILKGRILDRFYGYELSFTQKTIKKIHKTAGFKQLESGPFAFHANKDKLTHKFLQEIYFGLGKNTFTSSFYFIKGKK